MPNIIFDGHILVSQPNWWSGTVHWYLGQLNVTFMPTAQLTLQNASMQFSFTNTGGTFSFPQGFVTLLGSSGVEIDVNSVTLTLTAPFSSNDYWNLNSATLSMQILNQTGPASFYEQYSTLQCFNTMNLSSVIINYGHVYASTLGVDNGVRFSSLFIEQGSVYRMMTPNGTSYIDSVQINNWQTFDGAGKTIVGVYRKSRDWTYLNPNHHLQITGAAYWQGYVNLNPNSSKISCCCVNIVSDVTIRMT